MDSTVVKYVLVGIQVTILGLISFQILDLLGEFWMLFVLGAGLTIIGTAITFFATFFR